MKEILITGGAGFVGSHLVERYLNTDYRVTVIDNVETGNIRNFDKLNNIQNLEVIVADINTMNKKELDRHIRKASLVYHLASPVGVSFVDNNPKLTSMSSISSTVRLLPLLEKYNKKLIFASTSEVYGSKENGSFHEDDDLVIGSPKKLRWSYACSKLMQEFMIRSHKIDSIIVRLFNIVGPRQTGDFGMVLPRFINWANKDEPLKVFGSGEQVRCFCHISDCINSLIALSEKESCYNEIFNIGNDEESTIMDLAIKVMYLSGKDVRNIEMLPYSNVFTKNHGEIMRRVPNISKLIEYTGYTPKYNLDDIVRSLLNE